MMEEGDACDISDERPFTKQFTNQFVSFVVGQTTPNLYYVISHHINISTYNHYEKYQYSLHTQTKFQISFNLPHFLDFRLLLLLTLLAASGRKKIALRSCCRHKAIHHYLPQNIVHIFIPPRSQYATTIYLEKCLPPVLICNLSGWLAI